MHIFKGLNHLQENDEVLNHFSETPHNEMNMMTNYYAKSLT